MNTKEYLALLKTELNNRGISSIDKPAAIAVVGTEQILEVLETDGLIEISGYIHPSVKITAKGESELP